ncbi:hypothetical protein, partial [Bradyrhizobium sp. CCBAU 65884]|uniref:hypothetical protein n=1 Tax=Bradyrhizobium sp. CCBAU 65884 TaxID=722477 RepID=UPI0023052D6E
MLMVIISMGGGFTPTATQNGASVTFTSNWSSSCPQNGGATSPSVEWFGYLTNPTSGTFSLNKGGLTGAEYAVFTVNSALTTGNPIDAFNCANHGNTSNLISVSTTTPTANDLLIDWGATGSNMSGSSHGSGQTEYVSKNDSAVTLSVYGSYIAGS